MIPPESQSKSGGNIPVTVNGTDEITDAAVDALADLLLDRWFGLRRPALLPCPEVPVQPAQRSRIENTTNPLESAQ